MNETRPDVKELADVSRARAAFSSFLMIHFNVLPDEKFVEQMRSEEIVSMLKVLSQDASVIEDISLGASLMHNFLEVTANDKPSRLSEELGVDRTRLYRGISPTYGPPPPYEMVWSQTWQDVSLLQILARIYRENGLEPSSEIKDRLDYIGLELEFLHAMALREAEAWEAGESETAAALLAAQKQFLGEHLEPWVPSFVQKALEHVKTGFYHGHLLMLRGFILEQEEIL